MAGSRIGERPLDPVDAVHRRRASARVVGQGRDGRGVGRRALDVGEDDDRRGLARRELGLERDVGVAALDAGRVDRRRPARPAPVAERDAGDEQDGQRRDQDRDRAAHDGVGDALPARRPGRRPAGPTTGRNRLRRPPLRDSALTRVAEHAQDRRQERQREEHRAEDDERAGDPDASGWPAPRTGAGRTGRSRPRCR